MTALSDFVTTTTWALSRPVHEQLVALVLRHAEGQRATQEDIDSITAARDARKERDLPDSYENRDGVGIVPISGVIARHARQVNGASQPRGTSIEQIRRDLRAGLADDKAGSIMLAIDSQGGSVDGLVDLADEIRAARKHKRIEAHVSGMAASAAYWIAAQAHKIHATRGSQVGSIGVVSTVVDNHRRLEQAGVDVEYVTSVEGKVGAGAPGRAVNARDLAAVKSEVDRWHGRFVEAVRDGRGVSHEQAQAWGDARMHFAEDAKSIGLIDSVRDEGAVIESLRQRGRAAANPTRGVEMDVKQEGAAPAPAAEKQSTAATPTSARDLREAYPEAVAQIERDACAGERARVSSIASACEGQPVAVIAVALQAITSGASASEALAAMLKTKPAATAAAPSATTQPVSPTIDQVRAGVASNAVLGPTPAAGSSATKVPSEQEMRAAWAGLPHEAKAEFYDQFAIYREACLRPFGLGVHGKAGV